MASALETLCGQAFGAKKYHMLGIYMQRSWIVLFLCCFLLLPFYVFATPLLKLLGQPDDVAEQSGLVALCLIPLHFSFAFQFPLQRFLQSQLKTGVIAWVSLVAFVIHVFISWLFVYKLEFGIIGTAITLNFSWWILVFGMLGYTVCGGCPLSWTGFSMQAFSGLWEFVKLSTASGVMLWYPHPHSSSFYISISFPLLNLSVCVGFPLLLFLGLFTLGLVYPAQLGELVLQDTNFDDWELEECRGGRGCLVGLVGIFVI